MKKTIRQLHESFDMHSEALKQQTKTLKRVTRMDGNHERSMSSHNQSPSESSFINANHLGSSHGNFQVWYDKIDFPKFNGIDLHG